MSQSERTERLAAFPSMTAALAKDLAKAGYGESTTHAGLRAELRRAKTAGFKFPAGAAAHIKYPVQRRVASAVARDVADGLAGALSFADKHGRKVAAKVEVVGSLRRGNKRTTRDIDLLAVVSDPARVADIGVKSSSPQLRLETVYARGRRKASMVVSRKLPWNRTRAYYAIDLFFATPAEKPFALFHHTGSSRYNIRVRAHAKARGLKLNQYGVFSDSGRPARGSAAIKNERDLAEFLGVTYRPPAARER